MFLCYSLNCILLYIEMYVLYLVCNNIYFMKIIQEQGIHHILQPMLYCAELFCSIYVFVCFYSLKLL